MWNSLVEPLLNAPLHTTDDGQELMVQLPGGDHAVEDDMSVDEGLSNGLRMLPASLSGARMDLEPRTSPEQGVPRQQGALSRLLSCP